MNDFSETKIDKYIFRKYNNGTEIWYKNGDLHREDGPAIKCADGSEFWYLNGVLHREDGPAVKEANCQLEYWYNNIFLLKKEYMLLPISYRFNYIYE